MRRSIYLFKSKNVSDIEIADDEEEDVQRKGELPGRRCHRFRLLYVVHGDAMIHSSQPGIMPITILST